MSAPTSILVEYRRVYGLVKIYPANLAATTLAEIVGTRTLTERQLKLAASLGLDIERRNEELREAA